MRFAAFAVLMAASVGSAWAQGPGPWSMHDPLDWGMWLGPLAMIAAVALLVAATVALVRWIGNGGSGSVHTARDILDERYARGKIDREEYLRHRDDIAGRS